ncbi:MAG: DUF1016 domain-containing protein, partial [Lachnospiraceae bacterium]|nr:DUF1016 domain-containing protein [Candidatus Minthocola equi]
MDELANTTLYDDIRFILEEARNRVYSTANSTMVSAYWNIGKLLFEACGENERSAYGKNLLGTLSKQLTEEFGKGFTESNLRNMRQFFLTFPNCDALRSELNWTQYRMLMRIQDPKVREFYLEECAKSNWSSRQLERQINSFYYERLLSSQDKETVRQEITALEPEKKPEDVIHDPYVL